MLLQYQATYRLLVLASPRFGPFWPLTFHFKDKKNGVWCWVWQGKIGPISCMASLFFQSMLQAWLYLSLWVLPYSGFTVTSRSNQTCGTQLVGKNRLSLCCGKKSANDELFMVCACEILNQQAPKNQVSGMCRHFPSILFLKGGLGLAMYSWILTVTIIIMVINFGQSWC